ncbi:MAG: hypothetical protein NTZ01_08805 [Verrucomicrobia bacterium]|nr:hypothetical protein [Verrucomicrobiota bacterium]
MKPFLFLVLLSSISFGESPARPKTDELVLAQAEAKAYREAWLQLARRDELLGLATLSDQTRDSHDQVARLSGELIRSEKSCQQILEQVKTVIETAVRWAGESNSSRKIAARADFESAKRTLDALAGQTTSPRPLASGLTDAQVVAVDRDQQALVLNLGRYQGAREGMPFRILRGEQVIGNCRLMEVRELISSGLTEQLSEGIQPKVGDRVSVLAQK